MLRRRVAARVTFLTVLAVLIITAGCWLIGSLHGRPAQASAPSPVRPAVSQTLSPRNLPAGKPPTRGIVLSASERADCPPAASACADLAGHVTWLQSHGHITYGPVRMEPGKPSDPTPRGTFHVAWKAGAHYISTSYGVPIPYAVFFAAGGIAFHAGSLTSSSHGCIHLTLRAAHYYNEHLPVGAEVVVF